MQWSLCRRAAILFPLTLPAFARETPATPAPTPLAQLVDEALAGNPEISAANHAWKAATHTPAQVTTLPDPKVTAQQFSVGSPKPFAGYTNSDFAYIAVGASQELPFPGKLGLRGKVAERTADALLADVATTKEQIADAVKSDYLQLAFLDRKREILRENQSTLDNVIQDTLAHYTVGQGMQQDVLQAQLERTKLVRELTLDQQDKDVLEAHLKQLLRRDQDTPDIEAEALVESPCALTSGQLLDAVRGGNPEVKASQAALGKQEAQLTSAKREGKPDFELGYMYQNTDRKYRDYYVATLNVTFPRKRRVDAQVAEAAEMVKQSQDSLDARLRQQLAAVRQGYVQAASDADLLKVYRDGLLPQSDASFRAALNAYAANRGALTQVLQSFTDLLNLRLEFARTLTDHEIALAHLESLTGVSLR